MKKIRMLLILLGIVVLFLIGMEYRKRSHEDETQQSAEIILLEPNTFENPTEQDVLDLVRPTIVQIKDGNHLGSGSIFKIEEEKILIISNQHVIEDGNFPTIVFFDGTKAEGNVVYESKNIDLAWIEIPVSLVTEETMRKLRYVHYDLDTYEKLEQEDQMFLLGYTSEKGETLVTGRIGNPWWYVEDFGQYVIYNYCEAIPGMSGSGTFDEQGNYIGTLIGGVGMETASIPLSTILEEYVMYMSLAAKEIVE